MGTRQAGFWELLHEVRIYASKQVEDICCRCIRTSFIHLRGSWNASKRWYLFRLFLISQQYFATLCSLALRNNLGSLMTWCCAKHVESALDVVTSHDVEKVTSMQSFDVLSHQLKTSSRFYRRKFSSSRRSREVFLRRNRWRMEEMTRKLGRRWRCKRYRAPLTWENGSSGRTIAIKKKIIQQKTLRYCEGLDQAAW